MEFNRDRLLRVQLLNGCEFGVEGEPPLSVHKKPTKGEKLIARLVLKRGEIVTAEELLEIAGLERDERSQQSLKVHIHRLRRRLSDIAPELADCVMTWRRGYAWDVERCTVDLFEAERVCRRILSTSRISALKMEDVEELVRMFDKSLLPGFSEEGWVEQEAVAFKMLYSDAMSRVLMLMWQVEAYELIIRTCHLGMVYAPYEQVFWENLKRAMHCVEQLDEEESVSRKDWILINRYLQSVREGTVRDVKVIDMLSGKRWAQR